jgi:hypothetical protein
MRKQCDATFTPVALQLYNGPKDNYRAIQSLLRAIPQLIAKKIVCN